ncbi:alpha/beta hydrolase [Actinomadura sp. NBRC 104412]|uniref:alpha/beta fold hydrolase n=1 Tax=Actinomadura sp. NBRC 104412 TaxID=3032203 RepID=UPI0024A1B892|nr:alpha/beta hydrolase [Actinomadura sp. NBRC 104412]GLZ03298.1 alpha/beta hydrolase [Actinomadura sp. NBRC 104412]
MQSVRSGDGTRIAYERSGQGPPVVLVAGALCDRRAAAPIAELLSAHCTVYNYDRRGRGDSTDACTVFGTPADALRREIEDLEAVLGAAGGPAGVWGSSSGAVLAAEAVAAGLPITRLAMWEPPYGLTEEDSRGHLGYTRRLEETVAEGRHGDAAALFLGHIGVPEEFIAGMRRSPAWPAMEKIAPTLRYDAAALGDGLLPAGRLAALTIPVLVLDGGASMDVLRSAARAVAGTIPDALHRTLEGQEHNVAAEAIVPALAEFFAR